MINTAIHVTWSIRMWDKLQIILLLCNVLPCSISFINQLKYHRMCWIKVFFFYKLAQTILYQSHLPTFNVNCQFLNNLFQRCSNLWYSRTIKSTVVVDLNNLSFSLFNVNWVIIQHKIRTLFIIFRSLD